MYQSLNFNHGETIDMLRQQVKNFSDKEIAPIADKTDKENELLVDAQVKIACLHYDSGKLRRLPESLLSSI